MDRTYKPALQLRKRRKRPFPKSITKQIALGKGDTTLSLFDALYADNLKKLKTQSSDKENNVKRIAKKDEKITKREPQGASRPLRRALKPVLERTEEGTLNVTLEWEEPVVSSSFDKLLQGPSFQPAKFNGAPRTRSRVCAAKDQLPKKVELPDTNWSLNSSASPLQQEGFCRNPARASVSPNMVDYSLSTENIETDHQVSSTPLRNSFHSLGHIGVSPIVSKDEQKSSPLPVQRIKSDEVSFKSPAGQTDLSRVVRVILTPLHVSVEHPSELRVQSEANESRDMFEETKAVSESIRQPPQESSGGVRRCEAEVSADMFQSYSDASENQRAVQLRVGYGLERRKRWSTARYLQYSSGSCLGRPTLPVPLAQQRASHRRLSRRIVSLASTSGISSRESRAFRGVYASSSFTLEQLGTSQGPLGASIADSCAFEASEVELEHPITARDVVLQRCNQTEPLPFAEAFPDSCLGECRKIGEGVYGEVYAYKRPHYQPTVIKIIPIEGDTVMNGEQQKTYGEILSEIVIAMELSMLRQGMQFRTDGFSELVRCWCVQGRYPPYLLRLWHDYDRAKGSENDSPEVFTDDQLFIILELANGGTDLEGYWFSSAEQAVAVFVQVAYALAVAEAALEFEHRDLHWGNILIKKTTAKTITFILNGQDHVVPTKGVQVAIIDFTLSRMSYDGCCIYNDLSLDPTLFTSHGDYQFDVYRLMKDSVQDEWEQFKPYTNVLWLSYVLDKMIRMVHYHRKATKVHRKAISTLTTLKSTILHSSSALEAVKLNCL